MPAQNKIRFSSQISKENFLPTALVAGGAGFIGSYLCRALLLNGCRVIAVDNLSSSSLANLQESQSDPRFRFLEADLNKPLQVDEKIDYVFHLAGMEAHPEVSGSSLLVNSVGTKNLLDLAFKNQAKFLLGSSLITPAVRPQRKTLRQSLFLDPAISTHQQAKKISENLVASFYQEKKLDCRIARLGWVYGPRMSLNSQADLNRFFAFFITEKKLLLPQQNKHFLHPSFISDVVYGLIKAMFAVGSKGKVFTLVQQEAVSFQKLGQLLKKESQLSLPVSYFEAQASPVSFRQDVLKTAKFLGWQTKISLHEGVLRTLRFFQENHPSPVLSPRPSFVLEKPAPKFSPNKRAGESPVLPSSAKIIRLLLVFSLISVFFGLGSFFSIRFFRQTRDLFSLASYQQADFFNEAKGRISFLTKINGFALAALDSSRPFWEITPLKSSLSNLQEELVFIKDFSGCLNKGVDLGGNLSFLGQAVFNKDLLVNLPGLTSSLQFKLEDFFQEISQLELSAQSKADLLIDSFLFATPQEFSRFLGYLQTARQTASKIISAWPLLPEVIGLEEDQAYLVLLQNNMELRPTGGFIGSFGLLKFSQGRLQAFDVYDVYQADGQLKGHVKPPAPIEKYLGEASWYLRDSNWNPHFPTSALQAEWFLEKEMGLSVNGVFAVNLNFTQGLLSALGGVNLPDYQEKITAENLFEKAEYFSEVNTFPGSTQKRDFLASLTQIIFQKAQADPHLFLGTLQALYRSLEARDLLLYFNNYQDMSLVSELSWDGGLRQLQCPPEASSCEFDYLLPVEANLGVNKVNYFVDREIELLSHLKKDELQNTFKIEFRNRSPSSIFPGGDYKNYFRLYVPLGSQLESARLDNQDLDFKIIDQGTSSGKTVFGLLVNVPPGQKRLLEINYHRPLSLGQTPDFPYLVYLQKQSAVKPQKFRFKITVDPDLKISQAFPPGIRIQGGFHYFLDLDKDFPLQFQIRAN